MLPKLWPADAFPAHHSTHGALPTMSHFGFLPPIFSLDAGFQSCNQASIRLFTRKLQANRDVAAFLACVGWLFGDTIYSNEQVSKRL